MCEIDYSALDCMEPIPVPTAISASALPVPTAAAPTPVVITGLSALCNTVNRLGAARKRNAKALSEAPARVEAEQQLRRKEEALERAHQREEEERCRLEEDVRRALADSARDESEGEGSQPVAAPAQAAGDEGADAGGEEKGGGKIHVPHPDYTKVKNALNPGGKKRPEDEYCYLCVMLAQAGDPSKMPAEARDLVRRIRKLKESTSDMQVVAVSTLTFYEAYIRKPVNDTRARMHLPPLPEWTLPRILKHVTEEMVSTLDIHLLMRQEYFKLHRHLAQRKLYSISKAKFKKGKVKKSDLRVDPAYAKLMLQLGAAIDKETMAIEKFGDAASDVAPGVPPSKRRRCGGGPGAKDADVPLASYAGEGTTNTAVTRALHSSLAHPYS